MSRSAASLNPTMRAFSLVRPANRSATMLTLRTLSTSSTEPPTTPHVQGTAEEITFASKSTRPRTTYEIPEGRREFMGANAALSKMAASGSTARTTAEESFAGPSRPRLVYDRPKEARPLPALKSTWPLYVALGALGLGAWAAFLLHATNAERLSSSVLRQITYQLRNSEEIKELIGDRVHYAENAWGFGEPWISGSISLLQGKVDLKFRIEGNKDKATVYFTSIRPTEKSEFQIVRYKVIADSGQVVQLA